MGSEREINSGGKPYRRQLRHRLMTLGFNEAEISRLVAEHLITECQVRPRIAWRLSCELSLDQAAARFNAVTGDARAGMRGTRIWEYEQWPDRGVRPTVKALRTLAAVYGTTWTNLLRVRDLEHLPEKDLAAYHQELCASLGTSSVPTQDQYVVTPVVTPGNQDPIIGSGRSVTSSVLLDARSLTSVNVDQVQVQQLWSDINYLGNSYTQRQLSAVFHQLMLINTQVTRMLKGRQRPDQTRDLFRINAKCCAMLAWVSGDFGHYGSARDLMSAAWMYAEHADDDVARRWARMVQSRVAFWSGEVLESARLAAEGQRFSIARRSGDPELILSEARGWSRAQAKTQALDCIAKWMRIEDTIPEADHEDMFFNITKDRRHYMAGISLLSIGQTDDALQQFREARLAYTELPLQCRWDAMDSMIRIDVSRAYLRRGDLDSAVNEVAPLMTSDVSSQLDMVRSTMSMLVGELRSPRWQRSRVTRDLIDAFTYSEHASRR